MKQIFIFVTCFLYSMNVPKDSCQDGFHQHESSSLSQILQHGASYTWKEIQHHRMDSEPITCHLPEWRILSCPILRWLIVASSSSLAWQLDMIAGWLPVWWTRRLDILVSPDRLCLVTEVFLSSLSEASGSVPVTQPAFWGSSSLPCAIHLFRLLLLSSTSRGEVRRVFRLRSQDVLRPLLQCWKKHNSRRVFVSADTHWWQDDGPLKAGVLNTVKRGQIKNIYWRNIMSQIIPLEIKTNLFQIKFYLTFRTQPIKRKD